MASPERTLLATDLVTVGMFRCPPYHEAFSGGFVDSHLIVFPRTAVRIERAAVPPVVADPTVAVLYEPASMYRRFLVDRRGDRCDFFGFASHLAGDIGSGGSAGSRRGFQSGSMRVSAQLYMLQRRIFDAVASGSEPDPLAIEEATLNLLALIADSAPVDAAARQPVRPATAERHRRLAMETSEVLATGFHRNLSLARIAREVGSAPHHLCRVFRSETGWSIHQRLTELRLRRAMEILREDRDREIARIAIDLGFSSHSHFTRAFTKAFGVGPANYRSGQPELGKIVQAGAD